METAIKRPVIVSDMKQRLADIVCIVDGLR